MNKSTPNTLVVDFEHDDELKQTNLLVHLTNLLNDFGKEALIVEVVAYGPAIKMLTKRSSEFLYQIEKLQDRGVLFRGCHNAMKKHHIAEAELIEHVAVVPSGIGHIVKTQLKGAVYIKA